MHKSITMKEVAAHAGVSLSTVSRVLNHKPSVDPALEQRVMHSVAALQYTPNEIARNLKANRSREVAFIVSNTDDHYFTAVSRGIETVMSDAGYNLIICNTYFDRNRELSFLRLFQERRISGLVINTVGENDDAIAHISHSMPTVLCSRKVSAQDFVGDFVDFDSIGGMHQLTDRLLTLGHRQIALINGPCSLSTAYERGLGYRNAMQAAGADTHRWDALLPDREAQFTEAYGYRAAAILMEQPLPPTAIIAANSMLAAGALRYLKDAHIPLPDALSFCHFDNLPNSNLFFCEPAFMSTDRLAMGIRIGQLLIERIHAGKEMPNREIRLPTTLVQGSSLAPPRSSAAYSPIAAI